MNQYKIIQKVVHDPVKFKNWFVDLLKRTPSDTDDYGDPVSGKLGGVGMGYDDGYYYEWTAVRLNADGETLNVHFEQGSGSGWIPCEMTENEIPIEMFRQWLLNRKWKNQEVDPIQLLATEIENMAGHKLIEHEEEEW